MNQYERRNSQSPITTLVEAFNRLPGIGPKSAQRLAYHVLRAPEKEAQESGILVRFPSKKTINIYNDLLNHGDIVLEDRLGLRPDRSVSFLSSKCLNCLL